MLTHRDSFLWHLAPLVALPTQSPGGNAAKLSLADQATLESMLKYDPDLSGSMVAVVEMTGASGLAQLNTNNLVGIQLGADTDADVTNNLKLVRRLTAISSVLLVMILVTLTSR